LLSTSVENFWELPCKLPGLIIVTFVFIYFKPEGIVRIFTYVETFLFLMQRQRVTVFFFFLIFNCNVQGFVMFAILNISVNCYRLVFVVFMQCICV
jgi:hypothetical protein